MSIPESNADFFLNVKKANELGVLIEALKIIREDLQGAPDEVRDAINISEIDMDIGILQAHLQGLVSGAGRDGISLI